LCTKDYFNLCVSSLAHFLLPSMFFGVTANRENISPKLLQGERQEGQSPYEARQNLIYK